MKNRYNKDMMQHNQIGKYTKKEDVLNAKKNKTFVTPKNKEYQFDYYRNKSAYYFVIIYKGQRFATPEKDFNLHHIDDLIECIERSIEIV